MSNSRAAKRIAVACENCKRARKKCNGEHPCKACQVYNLDCIFDETKDGRRGRKRTLDQLYSKADALDVLLTSLRSFNEKSMQDLINVVREGASLEEIVHHTKIVLSQNESRERSRSRVQRTVQEIAALCDEPPIQVPAKPWTNVTNDDNAVSHLISIYFTWQNSGYPSVDQDVFVREMKSASLSSRYCCPLLVNSMLMIACMYTDHESAFQDPSDPSTRGIHFMNESIRLWTQEQENMTLVNLQAMPALISGLTALGRDRAGLTYTSHSITLATELVGQVKKALKRGLSDYDTAEFQRSYALAIWASFMVQTEVAIVWSKPLLLQRLLKSLPYSEEEIGSAKLWCPYPKRNPEASYFPFVIINERIKLYQIAAAIQPVLLSGSAEESPNPGYTSLDPELKLDCLHDIERRMHDWKQNLGAGAQLELETTSGPVPPDPLTDLHLAYNSFRISAASQILRITGIAETEHDQAQENIIDASRQIASIFSWRLGTTGLLDFGIYTLHAASLSAYGLLEHINRPGINEVFHNVIVALFATARRWTIARGIVKMVWVELQQRHLDHLLNHTTINLLKISTAVAWSPADFKIILKCAYPNYAAMRERGPGLSEMGELLEAYSLNDERGIHERPSEAVPQAQPMMDTADLNIISATTNETLGP